MGNSVPGTTSTYTAKWETLTLSLNMSIQLDNCWRGQTGRGGRRRGRAGPRSSGTADRAPARGKLRCQFENNYFTEMCSGSEEGSYLRLIDFVYHSTLGLRVIKKKKKGEIYEIHKHDRFTPSGERKRDVRARAACQREISRIENMATKDSLPTQWSTTLSSKINLPHAMNFWGLDWCKFGHVTLKISS